MQRFPLVLTMIALSGSANFALSQEKKAGDPKLLIGKWKALETGADKILKVGDAVEFKADGALIVTRREKKGKATTLEHTYTCDGKYFNIEFKTPNADLTMPQSTILSMGVTKLTKTEFEAGGFKMQRTK